MEQETAMKRITRLKALADTAIEAFIEAELRALGKKP